MRRLTRERNLLGTSLALPAALSKYALKMADPPVMIMVVSAAPKSVPATPNFEVTTAAMVDASPADITALPLTVACCLPSLMVLDYQPHQPVSKAFRDDIKEQCYATLSA